MERLDWHCIECAACTVPRLQQTWHLALRSFSAYHHRLAMSASSTTSAPPRRCSCARPCRFATEATAGVKRRWHDGSLENDLPFRQLAELFNVNHFIVGQTNPHLVPLMSLRKVLPGRGCDFMQEEIRHWFVQAQTYLPRWVPTKWMSLFTQAWEGDVTILLPWKLYAKNISKAMYNPTTADLREADQLGRRASWERMSAIQARTALALLGGRKLTCAQCADEVCHCPGLLHVFMVQLLACSATLLIARGSSLFRPSSISQLHQPIRNMTMQGNCAIELKLDECLSVLASVNAATAQAGPRSTRSLAAAQQYLPQHSAASGRIPSWWHLPTLSVAAGFIPALKLGSDRTLAARQSESGGAAAPDDAGSARAGSARQRGACSSTVAGAQGEIHAVGTAGAEAAAHQRSSSAPPVALTHDGSAAAQAGVLDHDAPAKPPASAPASPNGLAITSASSSSNEALNQLVDSKAHTGSSADAATCAHRNSAQQSAAESRAASDEASTPHRYGASAVRGGWTGLAQLAQSLQEQQQKGMGARGSSGYALDVIAP